MKINLNKFLYLPLILFFMPAFAIYIPNLGIYQVFYVFLYFAVIMLLICNYKYVFSRMIQVIKMTPLKLFVIVLILVAVNSIILSIIGTTTFARTIKSLIFRVVLCYVPIFLYFICIIDKYISYRKFIKVFYLLLWGVLVLGLFSYVGQIFNISLINKMFDVLANMRILAHNMIDNVASNDLASNYFANGFPRLDNLCEEPSFYARFLFLLLPLTLSFKDIKAKVYKNKTLDKIIKKSLIPLTIMSIILTQSPVYLIFTFVFLIIYFRKKYLYIIRKYYIGLIFVMFLFSLFIIKFDIQNTYLNRILIVLHSISSFDRFAIVEPSLASRIVNFYATLNIFMQHPFCGVGIANVEAYQLEQLINSPLALTHENIAQINFAISNNTFVGMNTALFYYFLASHGIFILFVFCIYHIQIYIELQKLSYKSFNVFFIRQIQGLKWCWLNATFLFFYHTRLIHIELLLIYALMIVTIYKGKKLSYVQNYRRNCS